VQFGEPEHAGGQYAAPAAPADLVQVDVTSTARMGRQPLLDATQMEAKLREVAVQPEAAGAAHLAAQQARHLQLWAECLASRKKLGVIKIGLVGQ